MAIFSPGSAATLISITILLSLFSFSSSSSNPLLPHRRHLLQSNSPQNIETFFPTGSYPAFTSQTTPPPSSPPPLNLPTSPKASPALSTASPAAPEANSGTVAKAVVATAATTLVFAGLLFFLLKRFVLARLRRQKSGKAHVISSPRRDEEMPPVSYDALNLVNGTLKGLIVDESGLDVLYWRQLEGDGWRGYRKEVLDHPRREKRAGPRSGNRKEGRGRAIAYSNSDPMPRVPSNSSKSSSSKISLPEIQLSDSLHSVAAVEADASASSHLPLRSPPKPENPPPPLLEKKNPAPPPPPPPPPLLEKKTTEPARPPPPPPVPAKKNPAPAPPPPPPSLPVKKNPAPAPPPPPPPVPVKKNPAPPPPPPPSLGEKKNPEPPSLPPRPGSLRQSSSASASKGRGSSSSSSKKVVEEKGVGQTKMKPLHWDKLTANAEHSMVWDKIGNGSFHVDDDLMEALFGYVATNRKSPRPSNPSTPSTSTTASYPSPQTFLLDPRKSQNIAIVLRSLAISRQDILDTLLNAHSNADIDTLEKLSKIAPTEDEQAQILAFSGNSSNLPDAESFLFHLLRAVPSPFLRVDAILFKSTYEADILQLKHSIQSLESACKELRTRGLFLKLLEAVLKAGNRMNAGTARGNAQAFDLSALRKLSDVKSTDGKTTLLHFVVEEVVRSEGKRCVLNRNLSLGRSTGGGSSFAPTNPSSKEEREREYMMLGLPVVGGLSAEFANVKKASAIDFHALMATCSALASRISSIRRFLASQATNGEGGGFVKEMKAFLEGAEEELKVVKAEEERVVELVRRTTDYYQTGASKEKGANPLQLFVIVNDFLSMVDRVCVDIARNQQQTKKKAGSSSPPQATAASSSKPATRFPNLPAHFLSKTSSSSDSEDGF